jgi:squalene-hopene/tetraprenyl-beta-curcumene cyclase
LSGNFQARLRDALLHSRRELLRARNAQGHWSGELSSSALSTATAVCALSVVLRHSETPPPDAERLIARGLDWLAAHANADGGWGDTVLSKSNISTTTLGWAAFAFRTVSLSSDAAMLRRAESWLANHAGGLDPEQLSTAIIQRYGEDRTFSVPILTMCAIAGRLGTGAEGWRHVLPLPFELAACPRRWFAAIGLPVVSYALPALIAMGQARHCHRPTRNPVLWLARQLTRRRTLDLLKEIQPHSGGYLEATPLTSFVLMSLAVSGQADHPVANQAVRFLRNSVREDGSWPIDTDLATWVTTLAVDALAQATGAALESDAAGPIRVWLLGQQYRSEHPYTLARPGGWAWTNLPGGVPDADDTAGALIALRHLGVDDDTREAAELGLNWLLELQNKDGGTPTFCRGWGKLPFDRSSPDLTAHALRAWTAWLSDVKAPLRTRIDQAIKRAVRFLASNQGQQGWTPLWFGSQFAPAETNLTYGNARVLAALSPDLAGLLPNSGLHVGRAVRWLLDAQTPEGAWGGCPDGPPSIEETALAVHALASLLRPAWRQAVPLSKELPRAVERGAAYLVSRIEEGSWTTPSPIGFYFAKLWYFERLYPIIFTVGALGQTLAASASL